MKPVYDYSPIALKFSYVILFIVSGFSLLCAIAAFTSSIIASLFFVLLCYFAFKCACIWRKIAKEKKMGTFDISSYTVPQNVAPRVKTDLYNIIAGFLERDKNGKRLLKIYDTIAGRYIKQAPKRPNCFGTSFQ